VQLTVSSLVSDQILRGFRSLTAQFSAITVGRVGKGAKRLDLGELENKIGSGVCGFIPYMAAMLFYDFSNEIEAQTHAI
jgi:hypothetical protein